MTDSGGRGPAKPPADTLHPDLAAALAHVYDPHGFTWWGDYLVVVTRTAAHCGQFVFPTSVLCNHSIVATHGVGGKRAMRV